ncbi:MAG: hypothetical protein HGA31_02095 [Candidatus Moranbacteria bacterium]|nr:hypothetical protein [Candidatus Moranbacteria bacterium]
MIERNYVEKNLARVHEWIKAADQKISIFLAFQGVLLTLLFPMIFKWFWKHSFDFTKWEISLLITASILLLLGVGKSFSAIIPRIVNHSKIKSLTFFGHIADNSLSSYRKKLKDATEEELLDDLISQTHASAGVAQTKHVKFRDSMITFVTGISILIVVYAEFIIRRIVC